ncbi:sugar transferase [Staphylococcus arlettae]|jgi:sugar transferase EpsL|uniref:Sugar transferase n=3 Tax=Staphylococcus arlettae TaxID=29378 RepID=A0ABQ0XX80_9STAP|nr:MULTISPECIES: sugar transferase [Staphylococcus]EJY96261.1 lipopolysaccharide synthesis sugar transferase [Staphylococcus arlettae CVD059]ERF49224.1 sugar transferase [Staphylococcus sp. EGD-HP3]KAB2478460.1 sugar transferase [Staphylococcus sp. CH99b_3]MCD8816774.1 sugar transferase [Staphylococcus arlettae]MCD8833705.1 sugar transferase [Staphylococcus arlettae]
MLKRYFDIVISLCVLFMALPLLIIVAILIQISMGRPIIFCQLRTGKDAQPFKLYKFRTMTNKYDEHNNLLPDEKRMTKIGRFIRSTSIDELPQLINVLKGDISIVGPRPLLMDYVALYNDRQKQRLFVKPGITGLAQISGRNSLSWERKFKYDVWYVKHQSMKLDCYIIAKTVIKVLLRKDICAQNHVTTKPFKGSSS